METTELIEILARDAAPVRPQAAPWLRAAIWFAVSAAYVAVLVAVMSPNGNRLASIHLSRFWLEQAAALGTGLAAAAAALLSVIPGRSRGWGIVPAIPLALWLAAAYFIYTVTLGPDQPVSALAFARDSVTTPQGWTMVIVGVGVGFLFALLVLAISVVSFPLLLDRNVGVRQAVATSFRAVRENPGPMAAWGLIIAAGLVIGAIPLLVGLAIILPILGHATWHLYRKVVAS